MKHFQSSIFSGRVRFSAGLPAALKAGHSTVLLAALLAALSASCAGLGAAKFAETAPEGPAVPERAVSPERPGVPERPAIPEHILGKGLVETEKLAAFLLSVNTGADGDFVRDLAAFYIEEAAAEGINHDVAFSQMCHETGFLRYGGLVTPDMNNFCGLGAIGPGQNGERFPNPRIGVRAHVQHLKGYASGAPLNRELVDPRYRWIKYGSAPTIHELTGRWASDREYGNKISGVLERLYRYAF
jgi:hypothetical protein